MLSSYMWAWSSSIFMVEVVVIMSFSGLHSLMCISRKGMIMNGVTNLVSLLFFGVMCLDYFFVEFILRVLVIL